MIEFEVRPWVTNTEAGVGRRQHLLRLGRLPGHQGLQHLRVVPRPRRASRARRTSDGDPVGKHFANFIEAVRSRDPKILHGPVETAHTSSGLAHLGNIAYRLGRKLKFDPATEKFVGDTEADAMLTRHYRAPFVVPEKV